MDSTSSPGHSVPDLVDSNFDSSSSVHGKKSTSSFGLEHGKYKNESSPDPCYVPNPKISRTSKDDAPQDSLDDQRVDLQDNLTPGPGAYKPEEQCTMRTVYPSSPAYSLNSRPYDRYGNLNPGPGAYSTERIWSHKPTAPYYSFGIRHSMCKAPFIVEYKD